MAGSGFRSAVIGLWSIFLVQVLSAAAEAQVPLQVNVLPPISAGISTPVKIASDRFGRFYVTDPRGGGVLKYSGAGELLATIAVSRNPQGIAVRDDGSMVVGMGNQAVILDRTGVELRKLGRGVGQFRMANGIAVDGAGNIYVVDSLDDCVQVFNAAGDPVTVAAAAPGKPANSFGASGALPGELFQPNGIAFEKGRQEIAVADTGNGRIQFYSTSGIYRRGIGAKGFGPLNFGSPRGISFEYGGEPSSLLRMYITDSFQSNVQVLDAAGTFVGFIGGYGTSAGKLLNPSDALFDQGSSRLMVANGGGNLSSFGINGGASPVTDTTPPTLTLDPVPPFTSVNSVTVSGTVEAGGSVTVNSIPVTVSAGRWSVLLSGLAPGVNQIAVLGFDRAGNQSAATASVTFDAARTRFTIAPVPSPVNSLSRVLSGTVEAGGSIQVVNNTTATGGAATVSGTTWTFIASLAQGVNILTVTASAPGKGSAGTGVTIEVVTAPPVLSVSLPPHLSVTSSPLLPVAGTVEAGRYFHQVTVNGAAVPAPDDFFATAVPLQPGPNLITVAAADSIGNSGSDVRSITYNPAFPKVAIVSPPSGSITATTAVTVTGTTEPGCTVTVKVNGTAQGTVTGASWSLPVQLDQGVGLNTIEAVATDQRGSSVAATTVLVDVARPPLAITIPPQDLHVRERVLALTVEAAEGVTLGATVNGSTVPVTVGPTGGTVTVELAQEGPAAVAITATDGSGRSTTTFRTVVLDLIPPLLTITTPVGSPPPVTVSGTIEPGARLSIVGPAGPIAGSVTGDQWSADIPGGYDPARVRIEAIDPAGNSSRSGSVRSGNVLPGIADAYRALRMSLGVEPPTYGDLLTGDVAPLANGLPQPDGRITEGDALIILRKVVGLIDF